MVARSEKRVIMVFDVPAVCGGALSILNLFHKKAVETANENERYIFVVSTPKLEETEHVKVLNFPWVKKSWFHRLKFDKKFAPGLIKEHGATEILSLQNLVIEKTDLPQTVYMHQSLPFCGHKFCFFKHTKLWIIQNILGGMIKKSVKKANKVTVQTNWIKNAIVAQCKVEESKIEIVPPEINLSNVIPHSDDAECQFFYPSAPIFYKNHMVIIKALLILKSENLYPKVIFTLSGSENKLSKKLKQISLKNQLNIVFAGTLPQDKVFELYSQSALIFPSFIETFGLPLLEARESGCPVICSNEPFCNEVLEGYEKALFFEHNECDKLAKHMKKLMKKEQND
jgi:glycosyltransferase involved in cell wall biosynthesis